MATTSLRHFTVNIFTHVWRSDGGKFKAHACVARGSAADGKKTKAARRCSPSSTKAHKSAQAAVASALTRLGKSLARRRRGHGRSIRRSWS